MVWAFPEDRDGSLHGGTDLRRHLDQADRRMAEKSEISPLFSACIHNKPQVLRPLIADSIQRFSKGSILCVSTLRHNDSQSYNI